MEAREEEAPEEGEAADVREMFATLVAALAAGERIREVETRKDLAPEEEAAAPPAAPARPPKPLML
jgi:hypothetical protein